MATARARATWVLLHGTPLAPTIWHETAARLTDQPVLVPDCTSVPSVDAQQRLADGVAEQLGDGPVDVVGHSFGGQIAIELALAHPATVRTLTVLCSRDTPFPSFATVAARVRAGDPPTVQDTLARWFTPTELAADGRAVRRARDDLQNASRPDWAAALDAIAGYDASSRTAELAVPVALFAAGGDTVSTPAAMSDFAGRLAHGTIVVRPDWMHLSPFVDPAGLAHLLRRSRDAGLARSG